MDAICHMYCSVVVKVNQPQRWDRRHKKWKPLSFQQTKHSYNLQCLGRHSNSPQSCSERCTCNHFTSCQSSSLLSERSSSDTWAQKAAISFSSPAQVMPQLFSTSTLGRLRRSERDKEERWLLVSTEWLSYRKWQATKYDMQQRSPRNTTIYTHLRISGETWI